MNKFIAILFSVLVATAADAENFVLVPPCDGDATVAIQSAIDSLASYNGKPVTLKFSPGNYNISRKNSSRHLYHISNTASVEENPDQTKHIGLWFRDLRNVTVDGDGAWFVTHGEMTPIVLDRCQNVRLKNFTLTAADPSVPEFKVLRVDRNSMTVEITEPSRFNIDSEGRFSFEGEGWSFTYGHAQVFIPERNVTWRCDYPLNGYQSARSLGGQVVEFFYQDTPKVNVGEVYQLRHGIRNEACGFINLCKDITLENIEFNFMGNFGLVGQFSENLTYDNLRCRPRLGAGRTDAGFADFVQMSGCKGKIRILNSYFEGAHDDPINIHGTHLKAVATDGNKSLTVRFMHGQTYGFTPFYKGDKIEIVDRHTLNCRAEAAVKAVERIDDYNFKLTVDRKLPSIPDGYSIEDYAVENVTFTPDVEIINNYFARTPTRGILITTRGKSVIADNIFFRIPMPAILVSDDARGWYESGPVKDLMIRRNLFIECGSPVISISPEIDRFERPVHQNIVIDNNRFIMRDSDIIVHLNAADNVAITNNMVVTDSAEKGSIAKYIKSTHSSRVEITDF